MVVASMAFQASQYDERRLSDYLFVADDVFPADLAVVFGMTDWRRPLGRALDLYRGGAVRRLLFTGGYNRRIDGVEATMMASEAVRQGVPHDRLLIDAEATNTAENVVNAWRLIQSAGTPIDSVILVAIHFHIRRVRLTAERIFPPSFRIGLASYPSAFYTREDWALSEKGRGDVFGEVAKIARYLGEDLSMLEATPDRDVPRRGYGVSGR